MIKFDSHQIESVISSGGKTGIGIRGWIDIINEDPISQERYSVGSVYIRRTSRNINNKNKKTLDVGVISINDEFQNEGYATQAIKELLNVARTQIPAHGVFVENILSDTLEYIVTKLGFTFLANNLPDRCYYKSVEQYTEAI